MISIAEAKMKSEKQLFVCEFITGGGMRDSDIPLPLLKDADTILDSLLVDLEQLNGLEVTLCRDDRLPLNSGAPAWIRRGDSAWSRWKHCMKSADIAWPVAPETDGTVLEINPRLTTSYTGLSGMLGVNVAELIMACFTEDGPADNLRRLEWASAN